MKHGKSLEAGREQGGGTEPSIDAAQTAANAPVWGGMDIDPIIVGDPFELKSL
jgi:hypothetical protein